jgi:hypothetical protein
MEKQGKKMLKKVWQNLIIVLCIAIASQAYANQDWKITLKVSGSGIYGYSKAGIKSSAVDGLDLAWDVPAMMTSLNNNYIHSYFPHPEWQQIYTAYREDIQKLASYNEWTMEVLSNVSGTLTITWPDLKDIIPGHDVALVDVEGTGQTIDMQSVSSFSFTNVPDTPRSFVIQIDSPYVPEPETLSYTTSDKHVFLEWTEILDPLEVAGYNVYRRIDNGQYQKMNNKLVKKYNYSDNLANLLKKQDAVTVYYKVATIGHTSTDEILRYSNEVVVTVVF